MDNAEKGIKLLFSNGNHIGDTFSYSSNILFYGDSSSFQIVRIASIFDLITFSTYSATSVLFAVVSFVGMWLFFLTFYKISPHLHFPIAVASLFIPSVVFWGSGIFKDTITLAALGLVTYTFHHLLVERKFTFKGIVLLLFGLVMIFSIKKYVLLSFLPALLIWFFASNLFRIKSTILRTLLIPMTMVSVFWLGYFAVLKVGEDDPRYKLSQLSQTVKITAYDIRYGWGARLGEGSGYTLGELDGTWQSMIKLAPRAINVSLFRPYFWEASNPLMLFSAFEGFILFIITVFVLIRGRNKLLRHLVKPEIIFCLTFAIIFAFAVGVSTFNFGTLSRYKIPMMPFFLIGLILLYDSKKHNANQHM
ncbi:MAG TPA: hypothetical protein PKN99_00750 [Cyclobacteriaceae bacterium]|nr:hypothetical protein [Cyclobacteriaceae bacterium]